MSANILDTDPSYDLQRNTKGTELETISELEIDLPRDLNLERIMRTKALQHQCDV